MKGYKTNARRGSGLPFQLCAEASFLIDTALLQRKRASLGDFGEKVIAGQQRQIHPQTADPHGLPHFILFYTLGGQGDSRSPRESGRATLQQPDQHQYADRRTDPTGQNVQL
ncbi:hypothetical protein CLAIMM_13782 [Cladophialophora immunda]|nr:hypothetical protein CLAIMM_13782 [Cladophialophora immunda]